jgi:hypothetical protein
MTEAVRIVVSVHIASKNNIRSIRNMADLTRLDLLKEVENLGIINIDVNGDYLSEEVIKNAVEATKQLDSRLNKEIISQKLREVDFVVAEHR